MMKRPYAGWFLWGVAIAAIASWAGHRSWWTEEVDPLPAVEEVRNATLRYFDVEARREIRIEVPAACLPSLFAALRPASRDPQPSKWEVLGDLEMTLRDGRPFQVDLYALPPDGPGAFSAGETYERRVYYRGGTTPGLLDALRRAREAASRGDAIGNQGGVGGRPTPP